MKNFKTFSAKIMEIAEARLNSATEIPIANITNPPLHKNDNIEKQ